MGYSNLLLEKKNGIAVLSINRPEALNALNSITLTELSTVLDELGQDSNVRVIILTGSGNKAFVAGADISQLKDSGLNEAYQISRLGQTIFQKIESLPQPVIAAINGFALGGGTELALACDLRLASKNARFGQPEVTLGFIAGFGGTQKLPRLIGTGRACELLYTGRIIDADEAQRIGLVNHVYPLEQLMDEAMALANIILAGAPLAVQASKQAIWRGIDMEISSGLEYEAKLFAELFTTEDQREGCSAFVEKRKPNFQGR